jgi:hypothetical protein
MVEMVKIICLSKEKADRARVGRVRDRQLQEKEGRRTLPIADILCPLERRFLVKVKELVGIDFGF